LGMTKGLIPCADANAGTRLPVKRRIDPVGNLREARERIDPQRDARAMLAHQLAREPPADAGITVVVDNLAEDVVALSGHGSALFAAGGRGIIDDVAPIDEPGPA